MATPVTIVVELYYNSTWNVITSDVRQTDPITITRGSADETSQAQPSTVTLMLNNGKSKINSSITGRYSPRNPLSDLYGLIGRNTPCRVTVDGSVRITGEVTAFPPRWDETAKNAWVPIQVSGILRRLGQGNKAITSAARSYIQTVFGTVGPYFYAPLDDGPGVEVGVNVGVGGGDGLNFILSATAKFSEGDLGLYMPKGVLLTDIATATVSAYAKPAFTWGHTQVVLDFVYKATGPLGALFVRIDDQLESGWQIGFRADGVNNDIQLVRLTNLGNPAGPTVTVIGDSAALTAVTDQNLHHCRMIIVQSGADTNYTIQVDTNTVLSGTSVGVHLNAVNQLLIDYQVSGVQTAVALGHFTIWYDTYPSTANMYLALVQAFAGERAMDRMTRICSENNIPFTTLGNASDTALMGPQPQASILGVLQDAASTDMGTLAEPRTAIGLLYISRAYAENRAADLTLSMSSKHLVEPFEPVDDDQLTRNDITVTNSSGASYESELTSGPNSTAAPPAGIGPYTDSVSVNIQADADLRDQAGWRLHLGTFDESRYPVLAVERKRSVIVANPTLDAAILALDLEQRVDVTGATTHQIYDTISQLVRGTVETVTPFSHDLQFNCSPARPFQVGVYDASTARYSSLGTVVASAATSGATTIVAATTAGPSWSVADGSLDMTVAGEEVTVTAIDVAKPSFIAAGTTSTGNNASVTPGLPAGITTGDTVLILASIRNTAAAPTLPANWTQVNSADPSGNLRMFGRVYDGVWTMPTVAFTGGSAGDDTLGQSAAFRGIDLTDILHGPNRTNSSQQNIDYFGFNTLTNSVPTHDYTVIVAAGWKQDDWTSAAAVTGFTKIGELTSTTGNDAGQVWYYQLQGVDRNFTPAGSFAITGGASAIGASFAASFRPVQRFSVTRSVNGVVKAHAAGETIELTNPTYYALT